MNFYLIKKEFIVPLKDTLDILNLRIGDIIDIRYYLEYEDGSMIKKLGDKYYKDSYLYSGFIDSNTNIFEDITWLIKRDRKINKILNKKRET